MRLPRLLMVTKGNRRSTVHRPVHLDVVVLKVFDDKGEVTGERMFVGLFTSVAYNRSASDIPSCGASESAFGARRVRVAQP